MPGVCTCVRHWHRCVEAAAVRVSTRTSWRTGPSKQSPWHSGQVGGRTTAVYCHGSHHERQSSPGIDSLRRHVYGPGRRAARRLCTDADAVQVTHQRHEITAHNGSERYNSSGSRCRLTACARSGTNGFQQAQHQRPLYAMENGANFLDHKSCLELALTFLFRAFGACLLVYSLVHGTVQQYI